MKNRSEYACQECGYRSPKWMGKCPDCGGWNTLVEEVQTKATRRVGACASAAPVALEEIRGMAEKRVSTGIGEFDRVLGGGVVPGSLILIGGDPGIGKSTLVLQAMNNLGALSGNALYVSGEESAGQTKLRAERLRVSGSGLFILAETSLEAILAQVAATHPSVVVVDSIQTVYSSALESAPGSVSQVRECAAKLMLLAKGSGVPVFIVGHVTKEGSIAGPRVLEHMVDTVLYFEGDAGHTFRLLRGVKNRFGSTNELGVFEMREEGLVEVSNPSELFLAERPVGVPGSVVVPTMEGTRTLLVELQALVSASSLALPRRTTIGVDHNRLALLVAVLEKKVGLSLSGQDIFLNAVGGVRITETAADMGMVAAVASSYLDKAIPPSTVVVGEVGLAGEVRTVSRAEQRLREAAKLGFTRCILPAAAVSRVSAGEMELVGVTSVAELLDRLF